MKHNFHERNRRTHINICHLLLWPMWFDQDLNTPFGNRIWRPDLPRSRRCNPGPTHIRCLAPIFLSRTCLLFGLHIPLHPNFSRICNDTPDPVVSKSGEFWAFLVPFYPCKSGVLCYLFLPEKSEREDCPVVGDGGRDRGERENLMDGIKSSEPDGPRSRSETLNLCFLPEPPKNLGKKME